MATIVQKNPANDPDRKPVKSRSSFKPNRSLYTTHKFGLNSPILGFETTEGDRVSIRVKTDLDTLNMVAPVMTPLRMSKDYFFAPLRAILPHNAELLITNPLTGQDINPDNVNTIIGKGSLNNYIISLRSNINSNISNASVAADGQTSAKHLIRALVAALAYGDPILSTGSLFQNLGCSTPVLMYWSDSNDPAFKGNRSWDSYVEKLCDTILAHVESFQVNYATFSTTAGNPVTTPYPDVTNVVTVDCRLGSEEAIDGTSKRISFRRFLEEVRQGMMVYQVQDPILLDDDPNTAFTVTMSDGSPVVLQYQSCQEDINVARLVAYQLACASFYTDDAVDYVYSCKLWHQNMRSCAFYALSGSMSYFQYMLNGVIQEYDSVSGYVLSGMIMQATEKFQAASTIADGLIYSPTYYRQAFWFQAYINNLFGYTRSLKFRDYFCGSKKRPMAVGDVNVTVTSGSFSVVDVTKNIQMQRFLNQVNRVGRKFNEYVQGIFGVTPAKDPSEVIFLGNTSEYIGSEETNNTGSDMMSEAQTTRSKMRRSSSQFAFEGQFNEPGVVIGIVNFDVARPYTTATDRAFFHHDRFDMFNPYLQHIGDQEVKGAEIILTQANNVGYQLRYAEYKQSHDVAAGGFIGFLPGYAFLNDPVTLRSYEQSDIILSPDFIRARPTELDKFYNVMSHYSEAGYFHFICRHDISIDAVRPMEAAPSIL